MKEIFFNIDPLAKPRMTRSDKWNKRDCVMRYRLFKSELNIMAMEHRFQVPSAFEIDFYIPIPKSVSPKKRVAMINKPHDKKPDIDNLIKAFMDSLCENDSFIWSVNAKKYWGQEGCIAVRWRQNAG